MASNREVEKIVDEISEAAADGIRQCLTLAEDLQEEGGALEYGDQLKEELLAAVRLERDVSHIKSSVEHVKSTVDLLQSSQLSEDQPNLLSEMEDKLNSLMNEQFDPTSHPSFHELTTLLDSTRSEDGGEERDDDIHVERVQQSLKCPLTGTFLENPVSNKDCGHVFSKAAVLEHIRHRAGRVARCPVCSGPLSSANLLPEPRLAKKARRAKRKENPSF